MFDVTSRITYINTPNWFRDVKRIHEPQGGTAAASDRIPIALCANKTDAGEHRKVHERQVGLHNLWGLQYFETSAKTNDSLENPFLWIARTISGDPDVIFVPAPTSELPLQ